MRLKETYLNIDITEAWNGRTSEQGRRREGRTGEGKERRQGDERELMMTMSGGCDAVHCTTRKRGSRSKERPGKSEYNV